MKKSVFLVLLFISCFINAQKSTNSYDDLWRKVYKEELKLLPKSSLSRVDEIYVKAVKESNEVQKIRCLIYQSKFSLVLEENAQLQIVNNFKREIKSTTNKSTKAILHSLLAHLYWSYFKDNRWKIYNRTKTVKIINDDFRTWDIKTLYAEIRKHFDESLKGKESFKSISLENFKDLIKGYHDQENEISSSLFEFLAHNALAFYKENESSITQAKEPFVINKKEYLEQIETYHFTSKDSFSTKCLSLKLYQELIQFHKSKKNQYAYFKMLLYAIDYIKDNSNIASFQQVKLDFLKSLQQKYPISENRVLLDFEIAKTYYAFAETYKPKLNTKHQYDFEKALTICKQLLGKYPKNRLVNSWKSMISAINYKEISCKIETYIPLDQNAKALVFYKNTDKFYGFIYKVNESQYEQLINEGRRVKKDSLVNLLPIYKAWEVALPNQKDYQKHSTEILLPKVPQGRYFLRGSFQENELNSSYNTFQITNLAFLKKEKGVFQVLNRFTGNAYHRAKIHLKSDSRYNNNRGYEEIDKSFVTDENGMFIFNNDGYHREVRAKVTTEIDTAFFENIYLYKNNTRNVNHTHTTYKPFVFTDRSIYRPGQKVFFKTIVLKKRGKTTEIVSHETIEVGLYDVNNQEVKKISLELNEFGTASSTFQIPTSGLNGRYSFRVYRNGKKTGYVNTNISIEEYKRPKFETSFKPVKETFKVNDSVTVHGIATALSGSKITHAKVIYRVVRKARFPRWCWWAYAPSPTEIHQGKTTTDDKGNYQIKFKALPNTSVDKKNQPVFNYTVYADVTDINGETRSTETQVAVGYHTLRLEVSAKQNMKSRDKNFVTIDSENLNGQFVPVQGQLKIYKLIAPQTVYRNRPWSNPDIQTFSKEKYKALFPYETYEIEDQNPEKWRKGKLVFSKDFNTEKEPKISLSSTKKWDLGKYMLIATSKDKWGQLVKDEQIISLSNPKAKKLADNQLFQISIDKRAYQPKDVVTLSIGSSKEITVFVEVEKNHKTISTYQITLSNQIKKIEIPVSEKDRGGFAIKWHRVNYNVIDSGVIDVSVPYKSKELSIEMLTFRDLLEPGAKQKWRFKIKGANQQKVTAEILASMYDASLDQFKPHSWNFNPINLPIYRTSNYIEDYGNFDLKTLRINDGYRSFYHKNNITANQFNWFGFSFVNNRWVNKEYLRLITHILKDKLAPSLDVFKKVTESMVAESSRIIGYGTQKKKQFTEAVAEVNDMVLNENETSSILIRGVSSLEGSNTPLYKVDGVLYDEDPKLNPEDIESIDLVQDPVVNSVYGARGVHGVIVIRTKAGQKKLDQQLGKVKARTNFNETAFFFPQLKTDENGEVSFEFTMPEDLTRWKLQLLAHDKSLNTGLKTLTTISQKQLMVIPNVPRFLREGDKITLSTKIANLSTNVQQGKVKLELTDPITGKNIDALLQNSLTTKPFTVPIQGNTSVFWQLQIPENIAAVQYKIVAASQDFSDGEQNVLPVLSNRMLVTETLPLWVNGGETRTFTLEGLKNNNSQSLKNHQLTLEMTSNPAWYAIQALPYLMEYPHECAEQAFARYYANQLANHIVNSNPKIKEVFKQWANSEALLSNLEKNQELKSIIIQETPWLRDAQSETAQKKRIALLFDLSKMDRSLNQTIKKLEKMQFSSGAFPWFDGSNFPNRYITQHIVQGFTHLKHLGVAINNKKIDKIIEKSQSYLDDELIKNYEQLLVNADNLKAKAKTPKEGAFLAKEYLEKKHLHSFQLQYLYIHSFDPKKSGDEKLAKSISYYSAQSVKFWKQESLYNKGLIALIQHRNNHFKTASSIVKSLQENSITTDEMGMYWKENKASWYWYQSPIETQSLLIEVFSEVKNNTKTVDNLKKWLLKNKQTQQWKTTKATSEAIYALLLQGSDWLAIDEAVDINIGGKKLEISILKDVKVEAGTGYFKTKWSPKEINKEMATITLNKKNKGIAWGGLYWQYFEDLDKIKSANTPLKIDKKVFLKTNTAKGPLLTEITKDTELKVGDLLTVRIELYTDREMEFIHMKDMRASGLEPVDVLSGYKRQDQLGYYQSTKDASTHFFFDKIRKGIYVFEYDLRVSHKGMFSNGITTIQSMYAPDFGSHSKGIRIEVK